MKRFTAGMVVGAAATLVALVIMFVGSFATVHGAPNYEDRDWTPAMNQTSYWSPWQCTKYDGHGGWIPAQYDAAIIKAGQKVRVYPDLTSTGGFQASAPDGKDISWVMKCTHPTQPTTTTTSTSTTSTTSTTTSTVPSTTSPSTTTAPTTTVETSTTTSSPPTTSPPETTSTTTPGTTVVSTTEPPSTTPPSSTSTVPETPSTSSPPPTPPTSAGTTPPTPPSTPSEPRLPETGSENWVILALAAALVGSGYGIVRIARRDA